MNKLPDKYSDLIELAIKDIQLCKKDKRYKIDMSLWHFYNPAQRVCFVCLAGSIMAKTFRDKIEAELFDDSYGASIATKFMFLDGLRVGYANPGSPTLIFDLAAFRYLKDNQITTYPTRKQFGALRTIARELKKAGY